MKTGRQHSSTSKKCSPQAASQILARTIGENVSRPLPYTSSRRSSAEPPEKGMEKGMAGNYEVDVEIPVDRPGLRPRPSQRFRVRHQETPFFFLTVSLGDNILAKNVNESNADTTSRKAVDPEPDSGTDDDMPALMDRDSLSSEDDMPLLTDKYSYSTDEES